jgi:hypothetical protein
MSNNPKGLEKCPKALGKCPIAPKKCPIDPQKWPKPFGKCPILIQRAKIPQIISENDGEPPRKPQKSELGVKILKVT